MTMQLPSPPAAYDAGDQSRVRAAIRAADATNYKKGQDFELGFVKNSAGLLVPARFIMPDEVTGARTNIRLVNGVLTPTPL